MSSAKFKETWFLYNILKYGYKSGSRLLQCFFLDFFDPQAPLPSSSFILSLLFISTFHVHARWFGVDTYPICTSHKSSCKAEIHYSDITSTLMQLES